jgi:hypothetical protein
MQAHFFRECDMRSESFCVWQQAFHDASELEQRFYRASLDSARGLEAEPSEDLHRQVEESQLRCRALLRLMLRDFALQAASARAQDA